MTEVRTAEEFLEALKRKDDEICITGGYCAEIAETVKHNTTQLPEYMLYAAGATMPTHLLATLISSLIESIMNKVKDVPKDKAKIEKWLTLYKCTQLSTKEICLRLNQLDYIV